MRLTLAQIEAFYWTARLGTVREAAAKLCISQPSLSLRLREIEKTLGVRLFNRIGRNLHLSPHGRALLAKAYETIRLCSEIETMAGSGADGMPQVIRLAVVDTFAMVSLSDMLDRMQETHPNLSFEMHVGFSQVLSAMMNEGRLDLALLTNPQPDARYEQKPLASIELSWMISPDCAVAQGVLSPEDLCQLPIYTNPAPSLLYDWVHRWFQSAGLWPTQVHVCNTLAIMAQLARRRRGATLLPSVLHRIDNWAGGLLPVRVHPPIEPHQLFAVWPKATGTAGVLAAVETARTIVRESGHYGIVDPTAAR